MDNKKVLLVVSHGSKRQESNQEFKEFIKKLNHINSEIKNSKEFESISVISDQIDLTDFSGSYSEIRGACLEFASPQLETVIENLMQEGKTEVEILPLFIFAGYHVLRDIPQRMKKLKNKYEELKYNILNHPAAGDDFAYYIFNHALREK